MEPKKLRRYNELNSEEINEIITRAPPWIKRWGIAVISAAVMLLVFLSFFITYPETVRGGIIVLSDAESTVVKAENKNLCEVLVKNGEWVESGTALAIQGCEGRQTKMLSDRKADNVDELNNRTFLKSSTSGYVFYDRKETNTFYIYATDSSFYGEIRIPQTNLGKIELGQQVQIRLASYPSDDYGIIDSEVIYISQMAHPIDDSFIIRAAFPQHLQGKQGKAIVLRHGMMGQAEIILKEKNLANRIFAFIN
ncbi:MAG: hypothetical protein AAGG75_03735 [Bacteroidota bacterium]